MQAKVTVVVQLEDGKTLFLSSDNAQEVNVQNHTEDRTKPEDTFKRIELSGSRTISITYNGPAPIWLDKPSPVEGKFRW